MSEYEAVVGAGSLRGSGPDLVQFPHHWTDGGVTVEAAFTGAHLLHLAAAGCVLNDVYREASRLGVRVDGVRVVAAGGFDIATWHSTGITYAVQVDTSATSEQLAELLDAVDVVAEIPKSIRAGADVARRPAQSL